MLLTVAQTCDAIREPGDTAEATRQKIHTFCRESLVMPDEVKLGPDGNTVSFHFGPTSVLALKTLIELKRLGMSLRLLRRAAVALWIWRPDAEIPGFATPIAWALDQIQKGNDSIHLGIATYADEGTTESAAWLFDAGDPVGPQVQFLARAAINLSEICPADIRKARLQ